ncbi:MAG TPA: preprotein translocase subunit SecA [Ignavibacteria bacterium]|mgnify:CR=1 FL=1|nr:preprotein translocase subunit SecA [Ignavibacteria bacterium]HRF66403.1 preprotein translocase subunit SecA [Ignavibacteria bacterium]HRJ05311.1 preprotein translocase subunit SecA [Ignavibacteria bacterium]
MFNFLKKIFPSKHEKDVKELLPVVEEINEHYKELASLTDDELRAKTAEFRELIRSNTQEHEDKIEELRSKLTNDISHDERKEIYDELEKTENERDDIIEDTLNEILPQAFAVVKDTCRRLCGKEWTAAGQRVQWEMIPFDVQLIGGMVLHQGKIAEMATGEGKTLVGTLPQFLNALPGKGVHIITVNDYLAKRDSEWMGEIFKFHGLTVGVILNDMDNDKRREAYACDIVYGTNNEFGFDYLRDNMVVDKKFMVQRGHNFAIVDEVDSVLIDEARTPLIISGAVEMSEHKFDEMNPRVKRLVDAQKSLIAKYVGEAEAIINKGEAASKDEIHAAGVALLRAHRGFPKNKKLLKLFSEPSNKTLMQQTEIEFLRDNSKRMPEIDDVMYFAIDEKAHSIDLTEKGREFLTSSQEDKDFFVLPDMGTEIAQIENDDTLSETDKIAKKDALGELYSLRSDRIHTIQQLLRAYSLYENDVEYVIQDNKIMIVDEFTGRVLPGRRYSEGLHQAIEAKEGVHVEKDTQTLATITLQNYFRLYKKLAGMTGTAETEAGEFLDIYKLDVVVIPTNRDCIRDDVNDVVYKTKREKYNAVIAEIEEMKKIGRPVLVGTTSVEVSETLSRMLKRKQVAHEVLNAKQHQREAQIIQNAGLKSAVTIATNMAGRGTDIKLGPGVGDLGGLHIIGTERHEARRIDRQLRGRAGRQGDPGSSKFFLSLEDDLMRLFGSERISRVMEKLGIEEGEAIEHSMITSSVERAQKKVEENNFGIRKRLLEYDNVMNQQREVIYDRRRQALMGERIKDEIFDMAGSYVEKTVQKYYPEGDYNGLRDEIQRTFTVLMDVSPEEFQKLGEKGLDDYIMKLVHENYSRKEEKYGVDLIAQIERFAMLTVIDDKWKEHLREMDDLKEGINFRAYGQKDPLIEYKKDGFGLFVQMLEDISKDVINFVFKFTTQEQKVEAPVQRQRLPQRMTTIKQSADGVGMKMTPEQSDNMQSQPNDTKKIPIKVGPKVGRNDPCPCGSGKKYKNCHGKEA